MPTIRDIAVLARVSTATVSHVLNESAYVSPELKERVVQAVRALNYHPNAVARSLRTRQSRSVGMIIPDITDPFYPSMVRGAEDVLMEQGYTLLVGNSDNQTTKEESYYRAFHARRVDGLLMTVAALSGPPQYLPQHQSELFPMVYIDRAFPELQGDVVQSDALEGCRRSIDYLIAQGHRRIGIVTGPLVMENAQVRLQGCRAALAAAAIPADPQLVREGNFDVNSGHEQTLALLHTSPRPTAIFLCNGPMAIGAVKALNETGVRYPDQIAVMSFDDMESFELLRPASPPWPSPPTRWAPARPASCSIASPVPWSATIAECCCPPSCTSGNPARCPRSPCRKCSHPRSDDPLAARHLSRQLGDALEQSGHPLPARDARPQRPTRGGAGAASNSGAVVPPTFSSCRR